MKQIFVIFLIGFVIVACNKKITSSPVVKKEEPAAPAISTIPVGEKNERKGKPLVNAGKKVFENSCGKCHDLVSPEKYSQERWVGIVRWMGPKAKLTEDEKTQVLAYVQFNAKDAPRDRPNM